MNLLAFLFMKSAGIGVGIFLGVLVGFSIRKKRGNSEGLILGSVVLTALAFGAAAQVTYMFVTYLGM